jgi:hypothetical protein
MVPWAQYSATPPPVIEKLMLKNYVNNIYDTNQLLSSLERRSALIHEMELLEGKTIHCFTCPGTCCTSQANSMQVTPIEALEILQSLKVDEWTKEEFISFKERMNKNISQYRLNVEIYTGKKNSQALRKNYTCPFFNNGSLGCGLSRSSKPYGCLGFNPKTSEDNGQSCSSNSDLLKERDDLFLSSEEAANSQIRKDLKLFWIKQTIPQALLDVLAALEKINLE